MAKKQTRRSISVSRTTYERLKVFCETNGISMSQFVETRVGDFLGRSLRPEVQAAAPTRPVNETAREMVAVYAGAPAPRPEPRPAAPVVVAAPPAPRPAPAPAKPAPAAPTMTADSIFTF